MNEELERTEELLASAGRKNNRKKLVAVIIAAAVFAAGVGVFAGIKIHNSSQLKEYLKTAEVNLEEGRYKEAIASYDKVLKIDDKNAAAYEGLGDAHNGLGETDKAYENYKKAKDLDGKNERVYKKAARAAISIGKIDDAKDIIGDWRDNIGEADDIDIGSISAGNTQENRMADGIVCQDGSTLYIANKPERGSITKVDKDGKETVVYKEKLSEGESVRGLNVWNDWLYYGIRKYEPRGMGFSSYEKIKKVRTDGTQSKELELKDSYFTCFALIQGKLYWTGTMDGAGYKIRRCDLDGNNTEEVSSEWSYGFITDGEYIYYVPVPQDGIVTEPEVRRINIRTGKEETVIREQFEPIFVKDDTLYGFGGGAGQQMDVYALDLKSGKKDTACRVGYASPYNINGDTIIWSSHRNNYMPDLDKDYGMEIMQTSLKDGKENSPLTHSFTFDEMFPDGTSRQGANAHMENYQIIGDKLYYCLQVGSENSDDFKYGCMNTDGTNNEMYY